MVFIICNRPLWSLYIDRIQTEYTALLSAFFRLHLYFPRLLLIPRIDLNASQYSTEHINHSSLNYSLIAQHLESAFAFFILVSSVR